ncbi:unnamed protein product [Urochloa humidicola]
MTRRRRSRQLTGMDPSSFALDPPPGSRALLAVCCCNLVVANTRTGMAACRKEHIAKARISLVHRRVIYIAVHHSMG